MEVVVALFLVGLLAAIAVPSWLSFQQRQQIRRAASLLRSALYLVKSESSKNLVRY
jgi:type II secretory pathway pseudopilin PulG